MDYNLASLRQRVIIDKLDDEEFYPGIVDRFINDTQRDIFNQYELSFQEKIFAGTVVQGTTMLLLPSDAATVQSFVVTSPDGQQQDIIDYYLPFREFNKKYPTPSLNEQADIRNWTLYANNIIFAAPTNDTYTLTTFYIRKPVVLSGDGDIPEIPEEFSELLVLGAYIRVLERNEDFDQADYVRTQYNTLLDMLVARYGYRKSTGAIKMKSGQIRLRRR